MIAASVAAGLPGSPKGVRLDDQVSVSASETETEATPTSLEGLEVLETPPAVDPPGSGEVTDD